MSLIFPYLYVPNGVYFLVVQLCALYDRTCNVMRGWWQSRSGGWKMNCCDFIAKWRSKFINKMPSFTSSKHTCCSNHHHHHLHFVYYVPLVCSSSSLRGRKNNNNKNWLKGFLSLIFIACQNNNSI